MGAFVKKVHQPIFQLVCVGARAGKIAQIGHSQAECLFKFPKGAVLIRGVTGYQVFAHGSGVVQQKLLADQHPRRRNGHQKGQKPENPPAAPAAVRVMIALHMPHS